VFEIRRKLPAYAGPQAEQALQDELRRGRVHVHPPLGKRGRERIGATPPDPKTYLRPELASMFRKLAEIGFKQEQLRAAAIELLHEEEWADTIAAAEESTTDQAGAEVTDEAVAAENLR
jgi:hypothetical protein